MTKRFVWADMIRILAIYGIIVLHVLIFPIPRQATLIFQIAATIAETSVPLLVMLSGALLLGKQESYTTFFTKRITKVIVPWISWTFFFTAFALYFHQSLSLGDAAHTFHSIFFPFFWFIVLICALYLITPALRIFTRVANTKDLSIVVILWFFGLSVIPYIRNTQAFPLSIGDSVVQLTVNFVGYFLIGFLITLIKRQRKMALIASLIFIISLFARNYFLTIGRITDISNFIDPGLVIVSVSLFALFYTMEDWFQKTFTNSVKQILAVISQAALGIYFVHYLFLNRAPLPMFSFSDSLIHIADNGYVFSNSFIIFILSFVLIFLLQKIPLIKHLIT